MMTMMTRLLAACSFALATALPQPARAQSPVQPEILILGTYHMANPGRDVLSARRQREITELLDVLRRFQPTKVAVEASVTSERVSRQYAGYLAGEDTLSRNETHQIGFRLARELGHETIFPVDEDGEFPYYRVLNYAKANGLEARFDSVRAATGARVRRQADYLRSHTVLEALVLMNSDSSVARDVGGYYGYVPFGEPYEYAGPDLVARWFERNIRIYRNIRALATSPDDRILVVYGAGHLGWLRRNVLDDPGVELRKLSDLIETSR